MATVNNKDFKVKHGLVVEGANATVDGFDVLKKSAADDAYIIALAGGGGDSANTPNTVVKRDENGDFAAGSVVAEVSVTAPTLFIGTNEDYTLEIVSGDLDIHSADDIILNANNGSGEVYINSISTGNQVATSDSAKEIAATLLTDAIKSNISITKDGSNNLTITAENGVADSTTDNLTEGTTNKYFTDERVKDVLTGSTQTNIVIQEIGGVLHVTAENGVADSTTDDLTEGEDNLYFTNQRAIDAGDGVFDGYGSAATAEQNAKNYADGLASNYDASGSATTAENNAKSYADSLASNYDAAGTAATEAGYVASDLSDHISDTSTHGVTGDIVGTTDTQVLTNKTINDELYFTNPATQANDGGIVVNNSSEDFQINSYTANLELTAHNDLTLETIDGNVILRPASGGAAYYGNTASAENEIATHGYVDNAVSGLAWKQAVNLLSNANVSNLTDTTLTIDGHSVDSNQIGYRVLLTSQTTDSENGIYEVVNGAFAGTISLSRPADADAYSELIGAAVYVMEGTTYGATSWVQSNHYLTDFTSQDWTQFSGQGSVTAGNGIVVDGLEVSIDTTIVATQTNLSDGLALKQDTLTAGYGIDISGDTISVAFDAGNGLAINGTNLTVDTNVIATKSYAEGVADDADTSARGYADSLASNYDPAGSADTAQTNAQNYTDGQLEDYVPANSLDATIDGYGYLKSADLSGYATESYVGTEINNLTSDDIEEGITNYYYTDTRAKTAAANLLTNSTLSNITITGDENGLTITAENGVADSTTDNLTEGANNLYFTTSRAQAAVAGDISSAINDLDTDAIEEGTSNLYFTDSRVTDAITAANQIAPKAIDITWVRREEATWTDVPTAGTVTAHTFGTSEGSVKYLVRVYNNNKSQVSEVLVTTDSSNNIAIVEYGTIYTSANELATISADWDVATSKYRLRVTTANDASEVLVAATMLAYND